MLDFILDATACSLTSNYKILLTASYSSDEIKAALDTMFLDKATGPDDMTIAFYKKN